MQNWFHTIFTNQYIFADYDLSSVRKKNQIRISCEYAHVQCISTLTIKLHEILLSGIR